jgi:N-hydroxyarylamine O-acetyltransferase
MLDIDAYFRRIGYTGSREPTLDTLRSLHELHPRAIPFENLDTLRRQPVRLDAESLQAKLVMQKRGGYCFEQNRLFSQVLAELGYGVAALSARVLWERPEDVRARTHMLLLVQLAEGAYLCDVGFGGLTMTAPLRLTPGVEQRTPHEPFRLERQGSEFVSQASVRGAWRSLYRFDLQEQLPIDIEVLNFFVSQHADSPFLTRLMAARREPSRTVNLRNGELSVHHLNGPSERRLLGSVADLRAALAREFSIDVPDDPALDAAFERALTLG